MIYIFLILFLLIWILAFLRFRMVKKYHQKHYPLNNYDYHFFQFTMGTISSKGQNLTRWLLKSKTEDTKSKNSRHLANGLYILILLCIIAIVILGMNY